MDCEQAVEAVSAALDGELTAAEQAQLEAHLSVCPACRALAEDFFALNAALTENEPVPPQLLADQVMKRIAEQNKVVPISAGHRPDWRRWMGLAAAAALVLCAGGLGVWLKNGGIRMDGASSAPMAYSAANSAAAGTSGSSNGASMDAEEPGANERAFIDGNAFLEDQLSPSTAPGAASMPSDHDDSSPVPAPEAPAALAEPAAPAEPAEGKQPTANNAAVNEEQALELVFEYLGGYDKYPEAEMTPMPYQLTAIEEDSPSYCLIPGDENVEDDSSVWLTYYRVSPNGRYYEFSLFNDLVYTELGFDRGESLNSFAVAMDGSGEILVRFPENYDADRELEYIDSYVNAVMGN